MLIQDVKKLSPMERLCYFIQERESIRLKKEAGEPKPFTDDIIFQQYKFTNVRRMDDRVSQWLLKNWFLPYFDHKNMLTAVTLAREINRIEVLEEIGFPKTWNPDRVEKILNSRVQRGLKNFSAAYMITGTLGGTKIQQVVHKVVTPIHASKLKYPTSSMEETHRLLIPFAGFATFIAGQVVADLRWAVDGTWADKNQWAPIGPGSRRGMNRFFGRDFKAPLRQEKFLEELQFVIEYARKNLPEKLLENWEAHDAQNCLCETDKMNRVLEGQGRPKQRYPGI